MVETLAGCKRTGTVFLVGGRNVDGVFKVCPRTGTCLFFGYVLLSSSLYLWNLTVPSYGNCIGA